MVQITERLADPWIDKEATENAVALIVSGFQALRGLRPEERHDFIASRQSEITVLLDGRNIRSTNRTPEGLPHYVNGIPQPHKLMRVPVEMPYVGVDLENAELRLGTPERSIGVPIVDDENRIVNHISVYALPKTPVEQSA